MPMELWKSFVQRMLRWQLSVAMVRELQSQELDVEAQAGGRAIATQLVVSDSVKDVRV